MFPVKKIFSGKSANRTLFYQNFKNLCFSYKYVCKIIIIKTILKSFNLYHHNLLCRETQDFLIIWFKMLLNPKIRRIIGSFHGCKWSSNITTNSEASSRIFQFRFNWRCSLSVLFLFKYFWIIFVIAILMISDTFIGKKSRPILKKTGM